MLCKRKYIAIGIIGRLWQTLVAYEAFVFNIKGNDYRLIAMILFAAKKVFIRWIGTHKEYANKDCTNA